MMHTLLTTLGTAILILGCLLLAIAAWGLHVLPDALSRQHAATKASTVAVSAICVGASLMQASWDWSWRLGIIMVYLMLTLPVASHMLARAAVTDIKARENTASKVAGSTHSQP